MQNLHRNKQRKTFGSYFNESVVCVVATKNKGVEQHMKKAIIPTAILCTAICIGVHTQPKQTEKLIPTPEPPTVEITVTTPTPIIEPEAEVAEPIEEVVVPEPEPTPEPAVQPPVANKTVQAGDMVYVPGFGWLESQGEGTVIYDEIMRENGNKVGIMD